MGRMMIRGSAFLLLGLAGCAVSSPGAAGGLPALDGKVALDTSWDPISANLMGGNNSIYFKMIRGVDPADGKEYVMLGLMVDKQVAFAPTQNLRVVVGLVLDESQDPPPCGWRIHVQPFANSTPAQNTKLKATDVPFWRDPPNRNNNTNHWNTPTLAQHVQWLTDSTCVWSYSNSLGMWSMEMKLLVNPSNCSGNQSVWFPPAGTPFRLYVDLLSTPNGGAGGNAQAAWPQGRTIIGPIEKNTPSWAQWNTFAF